MDHLFNRDLLKLAIEFLVVLIVGFLSLALLGLYAELNPESLPATSENVSSVIESTR